MAAEADAEESKMKVVLKGLPDALDQAVYTHEKWPLVHDQTNGNGETLGFLGSIAGRWAIAPRPPAPFERRVPVRRWMEPYE